MREAPFVTTFQNKDNLLIYSKTICKSSYKMQKNIISFFCTVIFFSNSQKFTYNAAFLFIHLFICVAVNLAKSYIQCVQKKMFFLSSFLKSFVFLSNSQEKMQIYLFISNYVYLKFSVFDKTNIMLNISTDF